MRPFALIAAAALAWATVACRTAPEAYAPTELNEPMRIALAGRSHIRAAYTAHRLSLFELRLGFLETLPAAWFPGTRQFEEGTRQIAEITGFPEDPELVTSVLAFSDNARQWHEWYVEHRPDLTPRERQVYDDLFARLEGTSPFLLSSELREMIQSIGSMSGLAPSWLGNYGEERYPDWQSFDSDRRTWRRWFDQHRNRLEWDVATRRLVVGRGLGEPL
ncbi:hypothetical protein JXA47_01480 [Candidatus Sumerlaeota bacterium]|nr:hypothetical protein [Candidatus Sumerlaeota bacterium]